MFRHWLMRFCFILPLLLCVGGWWWSGTRYGHLEFAHNNHRVQLETGWGVIDVNFVQFTGAIHLTDGWQMGIWPQDEAHFWTLGTEHYFMGFGFIRYAGERDAFGYMFAMPYWFLFVVFSAILFFVWRKTGEPKPGRAFPVEMANRGK